MNQPRPTCDRIATYERTSKEEAHPDRQGATLDAWAAGHKLAIARRFIDQGGRRHEADNPKRRPSYAQLIKDIEAGLYDVLAVEELSRLGFASEWKRKWDDLPTHLARLKVGEQMVEAELARLRTGELDLCGRVRGLFRELHEVHARVKRATAELAGNNLRRKSQVLRNLIERIECTFVKESRVPGSKQLVCRPATIRIVPREGTEPASYDLPVNGGPRSPP